MAEEDDDAPSAEGDKLEGMTYKKIFLSFDGRINRAVYWLKGILPLFAVSLLIIGAFSGAIFYSLSTLAVGAPSYVLTTNRGQIQVKQVASNLDEEIVFVADAPIDETSAALIFEINFDISLGDAAANLPKPLVFEKTVDAGSFRLTAIQTLDKEPYDGPIQWRIYSTSENLGDAPALVIVMSVFIFVFSIFLMYCSYAIGCKRCHDRGRSGWFQLVIFIPFVGAIWLFIELGLLKGDDGENMFGPDPLNADL